MGASISISASRLFSRLVELLKLRQKTKRLPNRKRVYWLTASLFACGCCVRASVAAYEKWPSLVVMSFLSALDLMRLPSFSRSATFLAAASETSTTTPSDDPSSGAEQAGEVVAATFDTLGVVLSIGLGGLIGLVTSFVLQGFLTFLARRNAKFKPAVKASGRPLKLSLTLVGGWIAFHIVWPSDAGEAASRIQTWLEHGFVIGVILALTWLVAALVDGAEKAILHQMEASGAARFRRAQTQLQILHRIILAAVWILGFAFVLMTFPEARSLGATLFTSAGLLSVVLGIAAQSTLGNVFAGLQLAFSDSIRMGDIVIWQKEFTSVEEITLTYVVLKVWDGRRLIVPSSLMTTTTFENWTRRTPELLGYVDFELDWQVPIARMRAELDRILAETDLWDGDTGILQVRDAIGTRLKISVLVSAANSSRLTDLKYYVREHLVRWIQSEAPAAIPHHRSLVEGEEEAASALAAEVAMMREEEAAVAAAPPTPEVPGAMPEEGQAAKASLRERLAHEVTDDGGLLAKLPWLGKVVTSQAATTNTAEETQLLDMSSVDLAAAKAAKAGEDASEADVSVPARVPIADRVGDISAPHTESSTRAAGHESSIFTGSLKAEKRGAEFSGPGVDVMREREATLERRRGEEHSEAPEGESAKETSHPEAGAK